MGTATPLHYSNRRSEHSGTIDSELLPSAPASAPDGTTLGCRLATHPWLGHSTPTSLRAPGRLQPSCPFKGAEPGLCYFRPKGTWRQQVGEKLEGDQRYAGRAPQKHGGASVSAVAPVPDVISGAEEAEWCSEGQTKGGAGGAQLPAAGRSGGGRACLLGGRARRAQVSGWGGTRGASCRVSKPTPTRPRASRRLPGARSSLGYSPELGSPGSPAAAPFGLCPPSRAGPRAPPPPCRGARAPSRAPQCFSALGRPGFPPRLPQVSLSSPGSPPDTHLSTRKLPPFPEVPPLGILFAILSAFSKVAPALLSSRPLPPPRTFPPCDLAGTLSRLGAGCQARLSRSSRTGVLGKTCAGPRPPTLPLSCASRWT